MVAVRKLLDASSGESAEFFYKDSQTIIGKFVISGSPNSNIKIFEIREPRAERLLYKVNCDDWNGATVELHLKSNHEDDDFSETKVVFSENICITSDFR